MPYDQIQKHEEFKRMKQQKTLDEAYTDFFGQTHQEAIQIIRDDLSRFEKYLSPEQIEKISENQ